MKPKEKTIRRRPSRKEMVEVYSQKGLNGLYAFLKKHNIPFKKEVYEFGLETNSKARAAKRAFVDPNKLQFHYYSLAVKSKRTKWTYNRIRAIKIVLL